MNNFFYIADIKPIINPNAEPYERTITRKIVVPWLAKNYEHTFLNFTSEKNKDKMYFEKEKKYISCKKKKNKNIPVKKNKKQVPYYMFIVLISFFLYSMSLQF